MSFAPEKCVMPSPFPDSKNRSKLMYSKSGQNPDTYFSAVGTSSHKEVATGMEDARDVHAADDFGPREGLGPHEKPVVPESG